MGRSLGGSVALETALTKKPLALVLISPITSIKDMARETPLFYPLSFLVSNAYNCKEKIVRAPCPVLVAHSPHDEIAPFAMGQKLYDLAPQPKELFLLKGSHNDDYFEDKEFLKAIDGLVEKALQGKTEK